MSGIILPPGVEGPEPVGDEEVVRPVELTEEKWPIAVTLQIHPAMPPATIIVPCGDPEVARLEAWGAIIKNTPTTLHRMDAIEAVEWKKRTDELNGFDSGA